MFYRVLPSFTEFYRVLPSFTGKKGEKNSKLHTEFPHRLALTINFFLPSFTEFPEAKGEMEGRSSLCGSDLVFIARVCVYWPWGINQSIGRFNRAIDRIR